MAGVQHSIGRMVVIMVIVVVIGIVIAKNYYGNANRSVDPRITQARELYAGYDSYARSGDYYRIFALLDSIEQIYYSTPHYRDSYELGVLDNNRAAALMTIALYGDSIPATSNPWSDWPTDSVVGLAATYVNRAISTYDHWDSRFNNKSEKQIMEMIEPLFKEGFEKVEPDLLQKYFNTRVSEIQKAVVENSRRLSVCYTNLGLVYRYQGDYGEAARQYEKALSLWDRNLDAENNLNKMLNHPLKKRNFIQKMFPPDRDTQQENKRKIK